MAADTQATSFVTGAAGFIGSELVKVLVAQGHRVFGLTDSLEAAERVRRIGAVPVMGDLLQPGSWQDEAAADWVFHVPPHAPCGARVTRRRGAALARARVLMDTHLLDAVAGGATRRIVYVADASCYGGTGVSRPITEDAPPQPSAWGGCLMPALERLEGYVVAGQPIVAAFPGWVYGDGGWFRQQVIDPIMSGRRVLLFGQTGPLVSPIHVQDCARALVHLAAHDGPSSRYFIVNSEPVRLHAFAGAFARLAGRPLRVLRLPAIAAPVVAGPVLADRLLTNAVFANSRLRAIGFRFLYPTLDHGLQQIIDSVFSRT